MSLLMLSRDFQHECQRQARRDRIRARVVHQKARVRRLAWEADAAARAECGVRYADGGIVVAYLADGQPLRALPPRSWPDRLGIALGLVTIGGLLALAFGGAV